MNDPVPQLISDPCDQRWISWITTNDHANFFHHPEWSHLIADCYGYHPFIFSICDTNGGLLAGLPMIEVRPPWSRPRWVSLPFTDACEPLYADPAFLHPLVQGLVRSVRDHHLGRIELRWDFPLNPAPLPTSRYTMHVLDLEKDTDRVANRFDRVHRQNIRQAEKNRVRIEWATELEEMRRFYDLQLDTRRRHGVPTQPWRYFALLFERVVQKGYGSLLLAYHENQCIAGLILLNWQKTILCKYAASREESMKLRPNNLLFWTAICWGCENGYTRFDMGRTDMDNPGLCRFKTGWGAKEMQLPYLTIAPKPPSSVPGNFLNLIKPIIQRSPRWVSQMTGEIFYKYFG